MRIAVCGLGHVGSVTVACLLKEGHAVVGIDTNEDTRTLVARGLSPIQEPAVADLIAAGHAAGRLSVATSMGDLADADMIIVCVGTPGLANGALDLSDAKAAALFVGEAVRLRMPERPPILLVFRSTMLPGSMTQTILPAIAAAAGESPGRRYEVVYNPEFIREGSAVADYFAPARIVIGERAPGTAGALIQLYSSIDAPVFATSLEVAELAKYADNTFHALKVGFANEIARYALQSGIRPAEVFDLFVADTKLNLSPLYLRPGGAFGGPCLPKDVRAIATHMEEIGVAAPIINRIIESNDAHTGFIVAEIERRVAPRSRILLVGLSFKAGTDDLRESPLVTLAVSLLERGYSLAVYDPDLVGSMAPSGVGRAGTSLPPSLSAVILSQPPPPALWDLVVVGKAIPHLAALEAHSPVFHIDRL